MNSVYHKILITRAGVSLLLAICACQHSPDKQATSFTPGYVDGVPVSQLDDEALDREARRLAVRQDQLKEIRDLRRQNDSQISPYLVPNSFESTELESIRKAIQAVDQEKKRRGT